MNDYRHNVNIYGMKRLLTRRKRFWDTFIVYYLLSFSKEFGGPGFGSILI